MSVRLSFLAYEVCLVILASLGACEVYVLQSAHPTWESW